LFEKTSAKIESKNVKLTKCPIHLFSFNTTTTVVKSNLRENGVFLHSFMIPYFISFSLIFEFGTIDAHDKL